MLKIIIIIAIVIFVIIILTYTIYVETSSNSPFMNGDSSSFSKINGMSSKSATKLNILG